jgi:hypothetical protein
MVSAADPLRLESRFSRPDFTKTLARNISLELTNSVALVRERTIRTERLPLVGEVSANFCG